MFKRGQKVEYTYPTGSKVAGRVLRLYTAKEIAAHVKTHGQAAADRLPDWVPCEFTDEHGSYRGAAHVSQLRAV